MIWGKNEVIEIRDLTVRYGSLVAISDCSLHIQRGTCVAILGPNGAGKTTLLKVVATLLRPESGSVKVVGRDCTSEPDLVRKALCYVPQERAVDILLNVRDNLSLFAMLSGIQAHERGRLVAHTLETLGLKEKSRMSLFQLSGGQVRRVQLSRVFLSDKPVLVLDEPTLGVDPKGKHEIWSLIRMRAAERGMTVLLATNDMTEAETLGDRIVFMKEGRIIASGTSSELKALVARGGKLRIRCREPITVVWPHKRLAELGVENVSVTSDTVDFILSHRTNNVAAVIDLCTDIGLNIDDVSTPDFSLDDVFMHFSGRG